MAGLAAVFGSGAMTNSVAEIEEADCIFVIGSNTTSSHPLVASRIMAAKEKGAKLIVVDPRRTQIAQMADIYVPLPAGRDNAFLNGLMHIIVEEGWHDQQFIQERTEGFEEFKENLKDYTPDYVQRVTGIDAELLREVAEAYAKASKASIIYCMGITQHVAGTDNVKNLANLAMLTGNVGKPSTGVNPLRGQNNVQGACDMGGLPNVFPGYQRVGDEAPRRKFEEAWEVSLPAEPGLTVTEMMDAALEGRVKALYIMGENPLLSDPDLNHVEEALREVEFLVVQDIFLTETARFADVILPGACFAEKEGTITNTERRVQRMYKAIDPPGEAKQDWAIICELAKAMGAQGFDFSGPEEIFEELARLTPSYAGISYQRIEAEGGLQWPCRTPDDPGTPYLHKDQFARGKGLFTPIKYLDPAELPDGEYPFLLTTGRLPFHFHTGTMTREAPHLVEEVDEPWLEIHPEDARGLGLRDGEVVEVSSRRGSVRVKARLTEGIRQGTVFLPFHFREAPANLLTIKALDPVAKIPEFKVCAVKISKVEG